MKEAKRHAGGHRCGNCSQTVKLRHDAGQVACTAHLTVVSIHHTGECSEYEPIAAPLQPAAEGAVPAPPSADSTP